jgi:copper homeostasis protein
MKRDLVMCQKLSADGVVFGILNPDGTIDKKRCQELIARARPLKVTCHRAFDMTQDPVRAMEDCIEAGFDRILTSGQELQAVKGLPVITDLVKRSEGRIKIMAGSGVNEQCVKEIVEKSAVNEIHFSATTNRPSSMVYLNQRIAGMGSQEGSEFRIRTVDPQRVRDTRAIAETAAKKTGRP